MKSSAHSDSTVCVTPQMLMEGTLRLFNSPYFEGSLRAAEEIVTEVFTCMIDAPCSTEPDTVMPADGSNDHALAEHLR